MESYGKEDIVNDYSRNLGSAALEPEPVNRLPERSGDARDVERRRSTGQP